MKRLALLVLLVLCTAAGAQGAACTPLQCGTSQFTLAHGTLLAVRGNPYMPLRVIDLRTGKTRWRLPPGIVTGNTLVHEDGPLLTWYDAATGRRTRDAVLQAHGHFSLVGTSQDAKRAVVARTQSRSTTFVIVSANGERTVKLGGHNWSFDALNGQYLFLIQTHTNGYTVRLYDLSTNKLQRRPLKDQDESALIQGIAFNRVSSPNGRYLFTLYVGGNGNAMVHELDTAAGHAYCIDLPGDGAFNAASTWSIVPDVGDGTLWAASPGYGRVVGIDVAAHVVRLHYSFNPGNWNSAPGIAVLAPDGDHIAFGDGGHVWLATPATAKVVREPSHVAIAFGFAPDQQAFWVLGEKSRVSRLTPFRWR